MKLTKPQQFLYWREFNACLRAHPEPKPDATAFRHMLHRQALGYDLSMKELGNAQFDAVLGVFRAHTQPDNLEAQVRLANMARTRLLYGLRHSGFADAYLITICDGRHFCSDKETNLDFLDTLSTEQLEQLRDTLADRRVEQHKPETAALRQERRHSKNTVSAPAGERSEYLL